MQTETKPQVIFRFSRPSGAPARKPSPAMTHALQLFSEADEMKVFVAKARAQHRQVLVQVFHSTDGCPMLIHTTATPKGGRK